MFFIIQTPYIVLLEKSSSFFLHFVMIKPFTAVGFSLTENINTIQSTKT